MARFFYKHEYGNPMDIVERKQLHELGCRACTKHSYLLGRVICTDERKRDNKNVPAIGSKCKYFEAK